MNRYKITIDDFFFIVRNNLAYSLTEVAVMRITEAALELIEAGVSQDKIVEKAQAAKNEAIAKWWGKNPFDF